MAIITADGRDITKDEWRVIPGFKRYKINQTGDLYSRERSKLLKEHENTKSGTFYYHVYTDGGLKTTRTFQSLVDLAWPEDAAPKKVPVTTAGSPVYRSRHDWTTIPGYPKYQIHPDGTVRWGQQRRLMKAKVNSLNGESYVNIRDADNTEWSVAINDLLEIVFAETLTQEEAA
jgi:hypothetical protein